MYLTIVSNSHFLNHMDIWSCLSLLVGTLQFKAIFREFQFEHFMMILSPHTVL